MLERIFALAGMLVMPCWILLAVAPRWPWTQRLATFIVPLLIAALYVWLLVAHPMPKGGGFGSLAQVTVLFSSPHALLAGWIHYLAFDLFTEIPYFNSLRTQFVHVMFDDDGNPATKDVDYGLFTHVEKMGKEYLINRGWPDGSNVYKAEDFAFLSDSRLALKEDGSPQSKTDFERVLSIENGKDHRNLVQMIEDINNEDTDFNAIFAKYFNRNNYHTCTDG